MLRTATLMTVLAGLAFAPMVSAQETPAAPQGEAAAAPKDKDEMVCKRIKMTGTRVGKERVCRTAAQWEEITRDAQDTARKMTTVRGATNGQ